MDMGLKPAVRGLLEKGQHERPTDSKEGLRAPAAAAAAEVGTSLAGRPRPRRTLRASAPASSRGRAGRRASSAPAQGTFGDGAHDRAAAPHSRMAPPCGPCRAGRPISSSAGAAMAARAREPLRVHGPPGDPERGDGQRRGARALAVHDGPAHRVGLAVVAARPLAAGRRRLDPEDEDVPPQKRSKRSSRTPGLGHLRQPQEPRDQAITVPAGWPRAPCPCRRPW
jgi:hypothetical protein